MGLRSSMKNIPKIGVCRVLALHAYGGTLHTPIFGFLSAQVRKSYVYIFRVCFISVEADPYCV